MKKPNPYQAQFSDACRMGNNNVILALPDRFAVILVLPDRFAVILVLPDRAAWSEKGQSRIRVRKRSDPYLENGLKWTDMDQ